MAEYGRERFLNQLNSKCSSDNDCTIQDKDFQFYLNHYTTKQYENSYEVNITTFDKIIPPIFFSDESKDLMLESVCSLKQDTNNTTESDRRDGKQNGEQNTNGTTSTVFDCDNNPCIIVKSTISPNLVISSGNSSPETTSTNSPATPTQNDQTPSSCLKNFNLSYFLVLFHIFTWFR